MVVTAQTFEEFALAHPDQQWELHGGKLREKPGMSYGHNDAMFQLGFQLMSQLDPHVFRVRVNAGHLWHAGQSYYIPDVFVLPLAQADSFRHRFDVLEVYRDPLPLVVEVWSPSTGDYDIDEKLPLYFARRDLEIWRLHPPHPVAHRLAPPRRWRLRPNRISRRPGSRDLAVGRGR